MSREQASDKRRKGFGGFAISGGVEVFELSDAWKFASSASVELTVFWSEDRSLDALDDVIEGSGVTVVDIVDLLK